MKNHAIITKSGDDYEVRPATQGAKTKVNGAPLTGAQILEHKDRILFGKRVVSLFFFCLFCFFTVC